MFDALSFPAVSPTAGNGSEGLLLGQINSSDLRSVFFATQIVPILSVLREDVTSTGRTFVDVTTAATDANAGDFQPFGTQSQMSLGDAFYFYVTDGKECDTLHVQISTPGVGTWTISIQEWDTTAESWVDTNISSDGSNHFRATAGIHIIKFQHSKKGSLKLYHTDTAKHVWHRVYLKTFTSATTAPVISRLWAQETSFTYRDMTTQVNSGNWVGFNDETLPTVDAFSIWVHPGPPIGLDVDIAQAVPNNYTLVHEYMASDGTWKTVPNFVDSSNGFKNTGKYKIRWSRPTDWVSMSYTVGTETVTGWLLRRRVTAVTTQGPINLYHVTADSRSLGSSNAQGLEYETAVTYKSATFGIGENKSTGSTVMQLINADTGSAATITIPATIEDSSEITGGKVSLSSELSMAATQSMIVMCLSGGTLVDFNLRLQ